MVTTVTFNNKKNCDTCSLNKCDGNLFVTITESYSSSKGDAVAILKKLHQLLAILSPR
jgi:hypothetical protein